MFNNKKDPLVDAVKSVIQKSEQDRQIERLLNESLGIESKKALPHEYHAQYDAMLNEAKALSPKQERLAKLGTVTGKGGHPEDIDPADLKAAREGHAHKVGLEEDEHLDEASPEARQAVVARAEKIAAQKRKALGPDVDPSSLETKAGKEFTSAMGRAATARSGLERRMKPSFGKNVVKEGITSAVHKFMSKRAGAKADHAFDMGDEKEFAKQTDKAEAHRVKAGGKPTKINTDPKSKFLTKESEQLDEKAVSKAQHRFFGLVRAIQKGKAEGSAKAEKAAEEMSVKQVRDYAKTKEKGLPEKKKEMNESLEAIQEEIRNTLWEKLDYVYENYGEEAAMEMYASLTEEEQSILNEKSARSGILQGAMNFFKTPTPSIMKQAPAPAPRRFEPTPSIMKNIPAQAPVSPAQRLVADKPIQTAVTGSVVATGGAAALDAANALANAQKKSDEPEAPVSGGFKLGGNLAKTSGEPAAAPAAPANIELKLKTMSDRIEDENSRRAAGDPTNRRGRVDSKGVLRRGDIGNAIPTADEIGDDVRAADARLAAQEKALATPPAEAPKGPAAPTAQKTRGLAPAAPATPPPATPTAPEERENVPPSGPAGPQDYGRREVNLDAARAAQLNRITQLPAPIVSPLGDSPAIAGKSAEKPAPGAAPGAPDNKEKEKKRDVPAQVANALSNTVGQELRDAGGNAAATSDTEAGRKKLEILDKRKPEPDAFQKATKGDWSGFGQGGS